jgi:group I intron endonuclease
MYTIYLILNVVNHKVYVGVTINKAKRWKVHLAALDKQEHHCTHLQWSWNNYGEEAFEMLPIMEVETIDEANYVEKAYTDWFAKLELCFNPLWHPYVMDEKTRKALSNKKKELGVIPPSRAGIKMTEEELTMHHARVIKRWDGYECKPKNKCPDCDNIIARYAKHCVPCSKKYVDYTDIKPTPECLERSAEVRRGKPLSDEHRRKQSDALKGKTPKNLSEIQQSRTKSFRLRSPEGKLVEGKNITQFARDMGLSRGSLNRMINGKHKSCKGWTIWRS